jgi:hypothetical protein
MEELKMENERKHEIEIFYDEAYARNPKGAWFWRWKNFPNDCAGPFLTEEIARDEAATPY